MNKSTSWPTRKYVAEIVNAVFVIDGVNITAMHR